jgi:stage V sporulation protein AD
MLAGHRTWIFEQKPVIISTGTVGGPFEADGAILEDFDLLHADLWLGQDSYEKAHKVFLKKPVKRQWKKGDPKGAGSVFPRRGLN